MHDGGLMESRSHRGCASFLTAPADEATEVFLFQSSAA